ncbi:MAG: hypothetical protein KAQ68_00275 [Clostridiales bacterium]|nr:hypothetical protein [Clostridiales bacterium]
MIIKADNQSTMWCGYQLFYIKAKKRRANKIKVKEIGNLTTASTYNEKGGCPSPLGVSD